MSISPEVNEKSNMAQVEEAIRVNAALAQETKITESAVQSEIHIQEGHQKDNLAKADNMNAAPSTCSEQPQGNAKSTEGGLATDIALEACGGSAAKLVKDGIDILRDSDPGKYAGMNTMENFTGIKGGVRVKNAISGPHVSDLFARLNLASESVNGQDKIKGAQADEKAVESLKNTKQIQNVANLEAVKNRDLAHARKAEIGHENRQERLSGPAMGPGGNTANINRAPHLALNEMKPKGPSQEMLEETGQA